MKSNNSHIEDIKEWQEKQYLPGYYVGGKISPILKQRTKVLAYGLIAIGVFYLLLCAGFVLFGRSVDSIGSSVWGCIIGLVFLAAGISVLRQIQNKKHPPR